MPDTGLLPYIVRIVSPGKSALSDFESDRVNVNFVKDILINKEKEKNIENAKYSFIWRCIFNSNGRC